MDGLTRIHTDAARRDELKELYSQCVHILAIQRGIYICILHWIIHHVYLSDNTQSTWET